MISIGKRDFRKFVTFVLKRIGRKIVVLFVKMNAERLAKLNAYLVSKGKKPKELNRNYIKKNVVNVTGKVLTKKCQNSETTFKTKPTIKKKPIANATEKTLPTKIRCSIKPNQTSKILRHKNESKKVDGNIISKNVVKPKIQSPTHSSPLKKKDIQALSSVSIPSTPMSSKAIMSKKLLRRSMGFSKGGKETTTPKTHAINTPRFKSNAKHSILSKSVQPVSRVRSVTYIQRSKTPAPKKRATEAEREQRMEKLRKWLISKGKNPDRLKGFKAEKTMLTPVSSPQQKNDSNRLSYWPSIREEDYQDEISILIKHTMQEARYALERKCSPQEVHDKLIEFRENIPRAKHHAVYWITMATVYERMGKTNDEILDLYERAVDLDAQPLEKLKVALVEFVSQPPPLQLDSSIKATTDHQKTKDTTQMKKPNVPNDEFTMFRTPVKVAPPPSPLVTASPSSVVKLRMISRSSPVFKQILAKRALPLDTAAIVTPVRRSKRIEHASSKYPACLLSHHPCITNPEELLQSASEKVESCDFVFDENKALGADYADVSTILNL